jgi:broad specificity phosphatase PhoE
MATIYLVRHGKAAAGFDGHLDPGLDDLGRRQATAVADELHPLGPLPIYSSPLARARETAAPLAALWQQDIMIEPRVAEIPSPTEDLGQRSEWLRRAMAGDWSSLDPELQAWRQALVDCLAAINADAVVFCHFIAINAAVGHAQRDDRLVVFAPDNGSITELCNDGRALVVHKLGATAVTRVN